MYSKSRGTSHIVFMQGRFLKSYNLTVKQMGGKKVHKKKSRGREKHEIQTGLRAFPTSPPSPPTPPWASL